MLEKVHVSFVYVHVATVVLVISRYMEYPMLAVAMVCDS